MHRSRSLILSLVLLALLLVVVAPATHAKRPLTYEDVIAMGRVSDPQISPDAQWVAYVVDRYDLETNGRSSAIWLASLENEQNRQLTQPPEGKRDRSPRWSPDGKTLAFLSNRSGSWQVWALSMEGGEALQRSHLPVSVDGLLWSPEGTWLAFTAEVYADCDDLACTAKRDAEKEKSKVKARLYDRLLYRHWDTWWDGKRSHVFVMAAKGGQARDVTPGDWNVPPYLGGSHEYSFSPSSLEMAFARNTDPDEAMSTNSDIWVVPLTGGEARKITTSKGWDGSPQYSPDGRWIAYIAMEREWFEADRHQLMLYERATGKIRPLTPDFDNNVGNFVWVPDSSGIFFTAGVDARSPIYRVAVLAGTIQTVVEEGTNRSLGVSADGSTLVFTRQASHSPAEVFRASARTGRATQVSHINDTLLAELEMNPAESIRVEGAAGAQVQSWLIKPPGFDPAKTYPVVILIHGGPQGTWYDSFHFRWNMQLFAAPGYVVVAPNPRGSPGWGQKFVDGISADWGGKVYTDIMKTVDYVETLPFVDKTRICAGGGSYGGYMANWILGHTDRFQCLFSHAGVYNLTSEYGATEELWFPEWEFKGTPWTNKEMYEKWSAHNFAANFKTPTLVIHGQLDYRVPLTQGLELFTALQRQGVPSKFLYYPDEGHWIQKPQNGRLWYQTVHEWLALYLLAPGPGPD